MGQAHVAQFERIRVMVCWHEVSRPVECVITDPVFLSIRRIGRRLQLHGRSSLQQLILFYSPLATSLEAWS